MRASLATSLSRLGPEDMLYLRLTLEAEAAKRRRGPVDFILLADVSGSMGGPASYDPAPFADVSPSCGHISWPGTAPWQSKLDHLKAAVNQLLRVLRPQDRLGVIVFSDQVRVALPLAKLTPSHRAVAQAVVGQLRANGGTDIYSAVAAGIALYKQHGGRRSCRMLLISDGDATTGVVRLGSGSDERSLAGIAASASRQRLSLSTLGVGLDYRAHVLGTMAQLGGGRFRHLTETESLPAYLREEASLAQRIVARGLRLQLTLPRSLSAEANLNGYLTDGDAILLGDLSGERDVVIPLIASPDLRPGKLPITATVHYTAPDGAEQQLAITATLQAVARGQQQKVEANEAVMARVIELLQAQAEREALSHYEQGDYQGAALRIHSYQASMTALRDQMASDGVLCSARIDALVTNALGSASMRAQQFEAASLSASDSRILYQASQMRATGQ